MTGFKFIFYRSGKRRTVYRMNKSETAVYDLLRECDYMTNAELAAKMGKTEKTAYRAIKALKENGYIARKGSDNNGCWKILK